MRIYLRVALRTAEKLEPYRTLAIAKFAADKISVLSYALVESASGCPGV